MGLLSENPTGWSIPQSDLSTPRGALHFAGTSHVRNIIKSRLAGRNLRTGQMCKTYRKGYFGFRRWIQLIAVD
jgi:hypothetical protein